MDKLQTRQELYQNIGFTKKGWRSCLDFNDVRLDAPTTRSQRKKVKNLDTFSARLAGVTRPAQVFWNNHLIASTDASSIAPIAAQVVWELFEANFRLELLVLDRCIMRSQWRDAPTAAIRESMVLAIFPPNSTLFVESVPRQNEGLATEYWEERAFYVENFRQLVSTWPQCPKLLLSKLRVPPNEDQVLSAERCVVQFYCQTFFNNFARAALSPYRLPPLKN
jgi:hypothetical protein